jgi:hypothetical protein
VIGVLVFLCGSNAYADPTPRCKKYEVTADHSVRYSNEDLSGAGGTPIEEDCLEVFTAIIRADAPIGASLAYSLPTADLFTAIDEVVAARDANHAKIVIDFYLPADGDSPNLPTELRVKLVGAVR